MIDAVALLAALRGHGASPKLERFDNGVEFIRWGRLLQVPAELSLETSKPGARDALIAVLRTEEPRT